MKKRILAVLMVVCLMATLCACGDKKAKSGTIEFNVPAGFTQETVDGVTTAWYAPNYPNDIANINLTYSENDPIGIDFDQATYEKQIMSVYEQAGVEATMNVTEFKSVEKDGFKGKVMKVDSVLAGINIKQIQYVYQIGNTTATLVFTDTNVATGEYEWLDEFEKCGENIKIVPKY